jgi:molecular chaperone HscB
MTRETTIRTERPDHPTAQRRLSDDDFALFDLPRRFDLDRNDLDSRWRALQTSVHPDRFVSQGPAAQRLAMQWAVRVNQAYARLKQPLARAAYLCELMGAGVDAQNNTAMPPVFLAQQMAWRQALDEAEGVAAVQALHDEVAAQESVMLAQLAVLLDQHGDAPAAAAQVRALMFVTRFGTDIDRRLESLEHPG